eukprot:GHVN01015848.1.p1 GENE.GHVN01015848.1~~GHVN01015848.1.p1  ORF type:complete len:159 (-),score=35.48 GHVN01015848.1:131-607(-)
MSGKDPPPSGPLGDPTDEPQTLADVFNSPENQGAEVVLPLSWCPHLKDHVSPDSPPTISLTLPCEICDNKGENWMCLKCHGVFCSRYVNEHMMLHGAEMEHLMCISFSDLSVWCYGCENYVDNKCFYGFKDSLHREKFGTPCPISRDDGCEVIEIEMK